MCVSQPLWQALETGESRVTAWYYALLLGAKLGAMSVQASVDNKTRQREERDDRGSKVK